MNGAGKPGWRGYLQADGLLAVPTTDKTWVKPYTERDFNTYVVMSQWFGFITLVGVYVMDDAFFMRVALEEAAKALEYGDVPIGAVAVRGEAIIGRGYNCRERDQDPTAHAEMIALREAAVVAGSWRLEGVTLYCTLEPCCMCAGAMVLARLPRLVYATIDPKAGCGGSVYDVLREPRFNHSVHVDRGVLAEEAGEQIRMFFRGLRGTPP